MTITAVTATEKPVHAVAQSACHCLLNAQAANGVEVQKNIQIVTLIVHVHVIHALHEKHHQTQYQTQKLEMMQMRHHQIERLKA